MWLIIMEIEARKVSIGGPCTCLHMIMAFGWRGQRKKKKMMMMPDQTWTKCCSLNNACIYGFRAKRAKVAAVNDGLLKIPLLQNIYVYIHICMYMYRGWTSLSWWKSTRVFSYFPFASRHNNYLIQILIPSSID